jgi:hypothetical protein
MTSLPTVPIINPAWSAIVAGRPKHFGLVSSAEVVVSPVAITTARTRADPNPLNRNLSISVISSVHVLSN